MAIPRMSVDALMAKLWTEKKSLCTIVEGFTDRKILGKFINDQSLDAAVYCIDEIEVELNHEFRDFGGNKGRVISLFSENDIKPFIDKNAIGIIDRDIDFFINREVNVRGFYYTEFSCLMSRLFCEEYLSDMVFDVFSKRISRQFIDELMDFSSRYFFMFCLKQEICPDRSLPDIKKSVRQICKGGFDWELYTLKVTQCTGIDRKKLKSSPTSTDHDPRSSICLHISIEYMWLLGRKEGIFDQSVSREELYRHLIGKCHSTLGGCGVADIIYEKSKRLTDGVVY